MGSQSFCIEVKGASAKDAYREAVEEATFYHGHDPYSGTIATTQGFKMYEYTKSKEFPKVNDYINHLMNKLSKWDPCGCIVIKSEKVDVPYYDKVKVTKPTKVKKEWITKYVVKVFRVESDKVVGTFKTLSEAKAKAIEFSKQNQESVYVEQEKVLKSGSPIELKVEIDRTKPKKKKETINTYVFFGWASC